MSQAHTGEVPSSGNMVWCQWVRVAKSKFRVGESYLAVLWRCKLTLTLSLYSDADVSVPSKEYCSAALRGATVTQVCKIRCGNSAS
jgi:hypothetical protein